MRYCNQGRLATHFIIYAERFCQLFPHRIGEFTSVLQPEGLSAFITWSQGYGTDIFRLSIYLFTGNRQPVDFQLAQVISLKMHL